MNTGTIATHAFLVLVSLIVQDPLHFVPLLCATSATGSTPGRINGPIYWHNRCLRPCHDDDDDNDGTSTSLPSPSSSCDLVVQRFLPNSAWRLTCGDTRRHLTAAATTLHDA
ncbi:hypothetical protein LY76DRAFT_234545 [Colletotrichum caudatum]|nr:hypothetical protein LY76DRAFT_234545 [Colletotrichum caudatum]